MDARIFLGEFRPFRRGEIALARRLVEAGLTSEVALDAELATKRLVLVLGGAAGSGYVFLGALHRLEAQGLRPSYLAGCSVGSILAVIRARTPGFELRELLEHIRRLRERVAFRAPACPRFRLPGELRLDLRRALGDLFEVGGRCRWNWQRCHFVPGKRADKAAWIPL